MAKKSKTPYQKLQTKIKSILVNNKGLKKTKGINDIKYKNELLLSYSAKLVHFTKKRFYPRAEKKIDISEFEVKIHLNQNTVELISRSSIKPPTFVPYLRTIFKSAAKTDFSLIEIGAGEDKIDGKTLKITYSTYRTLEKINREEKTDETIRFKTRASTLLDKNYNISLGIDTSKIDWGARLQEILISGQFNQNDLQSLTAKLDPGDSNKIVIKKQVEKQVEWLLQKLEEILDETNLTKSKAKQLGSKIFNYPQLEINGPEHLMEKILTDYGQNTLFGVPALINTDKYVLQNNLPRNQFDILLITSYGEVEIVELKCPDVIVFEYDDSRGKFYASEELSKAISQTERYLSSMIKDNDDELKINGLKIRDYINSELGGNITVETLRPTGLIIIGSSQSLCKPYDDLSASIKKKVKKLAYNDNCERAYREIKDSHKNIKIITYSDLVESARLRLQLIK